jgi:O-antigen biosynthesis protein WbqP
MPKFRTMEIDTPQVATHLLLNSSSHITNFGQLLRKSSLDELPQLWSIIIGNMSVVGPRPALFNQHDLIEMRKEANVHTILPGLTGLAQVSGRDDIPLEEKVNFDIDYLNRKSFFIDLKIISLTVLKVLAPKDISH